MKSFLMFCLVLMCGGLGSANSARATTWTDSELTDPISGEAVPARAIVSYGGYIYGWPSKYDLVFWPLTDANYICLYPKTGYAAFNGDFEKLPEEQQKPLQEWLSKNFDPAKPPKTHLEQLTWLEQVYAQRKMDEEFWCKFYRLMAFMHREDEKVSIAYVEKAVPLLKKKLESKPEGFEKLEALYLLGEYSRRLGDRTKAEEYFAQVKDVKYEDQEGNEAIEHPYFMGLVEERRALLAEGSKPKKDIAEKQDSDQ